MTMTSLITYFVQWDVLFFWVMMPFVDLYQLILPVVAI